VTTVGAMFFTGQPKIMSYKIDEKQVAGSMPYQIAGKKKPTWDTKLLNPSQSLPTDQSCWDSYIAVPKPKATMKAHLGFNVTLRSQHCGRCPKLCPPQKQKKR